jgi:hypothetical protein
MESNNMTYLSIESVRSGSGYGKGCKTGNHWMAPTDVTRKNDLFYLLGRFQKIILILGSLYI